MLEKIRDIILETEVFILTSKLIAHSLDDETQDKVLEPLEECVELLKQVEKKLKEHSKWAHEELDRLNQND